LARIGTNPDDYAFILTPEQCEEALNERWGVPTHFAFGTHVSQRAKDMLVIPKAHIDDFIA
jgi:hypothetical protein